MKRQNIPYPLEDSAAQPTQEIEGTQKTKYHLILKTDKNTEKRNREKKKEQKQAFEAHSKLKRKNTGKIIVLVPPTMLDLINQNKKTNLNSVQNQYILKVRGTAAAEIRRIIILTQK